VAGTFALPLTMGSSSENTPPHRVSQLITQVFCQLLVVFATMLPRKPA
jgi:hypothetical protein